MYEREDPKKNFPKLSKRKGGCLKLFSQTIKKKEKRIWLFLVSMALLSRFYVFHVFKLVDFVINSVVLRAVQQAQLTKGGNACFTGRSYPPDRIGFVSQSLQL